jgi:cytochrome c553
MAHIKEPLDVDFFVEPQPLSDAERKMISAHIQNYKKKNAEKNKPKVTVKKKLLAAAV